MKKISFLFAAVVLIGSISAFTVNRIKNLNDEKAITDMLERCYIHGAFNELNPKAMSEGFHKDFAIFNTYDDQLTRYEIEDWVKNVEKKKNSAEFDPKKNVWEHEFASVDVTGKAAAVKVLLHKDGKHVFTDYLSLLQFPDGWKVVAKVYTKHE